MEPALFAVWLFVLLLYSWSVSGGGNIPQQESESLTGSALNRNVHVMSVPLTDHV